MKCMSAVGQVALIATMMHRPRIIFVRDHTRACASDSAASRFTATARRHEATGLS